MGLTCGPCMADVEPEDLRAWMIPPLWQHDGDNDGCDFCLRDAQLLNILYSSLDYLRLVLHRPAYRH
jgi:hypothetical protein